jgi:phosphate transport system substrate-binding protein
MSYVRTIFLFLYLIIVFGCKQGKSKPGQVELSSDSRIELSGNFSISGAYALYPLVSRWAIDFMKIHPSVKIVVEAGGTGKGIDDLENKRTQLAMISRPLSDTELGEGIWTVSVAKDGVAAIVNQKNTYIKQILYHGLSPDELLKVFAGTTTIEWGELLDTSGNDKISVYKRVDDSGAAEVFAQFLNKESIDLKGTVVTSDDEMIKSIQDNPFAIGFSNFSYAFNSATGDRRKDIQIIPVDLDYDNKIDTKEIPFSNLEKAHRGLWLGLYPKSLCRELLIGSTGKPSDPAVIEFLKYSLTDGQNDIKTLGLCELNNVYVGYFLDKLK